jgi:membrane-associated phospholipid phosphatase
MAAREFGGQPIAWQKDDASLLRDGWMEPIDLGWVKFDFIRAEIEELQQLMQDDRDRYLAEIIDQADGLAEYVIAFINANQFRYPWTIELINCGLAIGNIAYMFYKARFKRVRPSTLCPGLIPPFGPPAHPAFPSGHSFLGHLIALLLLEIPAIQQRYGVFGPNFDGSVGKHVDPHSPMAVKVSHSAPALVTGQLNGADAPLPGLSPDDPFVFEKITGATLPPPIISEKVYYVHTIVPPASFTLSDRPGGKQIATTARGRGSHVVIRNPLTGRTEIKSPLLWLAARLAKNRERLGVHYPSDSSASRHLAAAIWRALLHDTNSSSRIDCPTLLAVLDHAKSEWNRWSV